MSRRSDEWRRRSAAHRPVPAPVRRARAARGGGLVPLDTRRIREDALQEYRQAERQLAQLKRHLQRYHERDLPGFHAWIHRTFGRQLTLQRELLQAVEEKQALLREVEYWIIERGLSHGAAYRHVLWRRAHPAEAEAQDRQYEERARQNTRWQDPGADPWTEEEIGDEPEDDGPFGESDFGDIPDDAWEDFSDFVEEFTGHRPPPRETRRAAPPPPENASAKALYRQIVRRLHPDHHGRMTEARAELWHAAQDAYRRGDVEALQGVLARCDGDAGGLNPASSVALIRRLTRDLQQALRAVRSDTRRFRKEPAWGYERRLRDPRFVARIAADMDDARFELEQTLRELDRGIARLERKAGPRPRRERPTPHNLQGELPF